MPGPGLDLYGEEELAELADVIRARRISRYGPDDATFPAKVRTLEEEVCRLAGARFALAVNSGSSALLLAQAALGVGPGDEVIVPGFTFVASISSIVYSGARPVLAEIDESFDLDPRDVEGKITPRTRAIIAVHMLGSPAKLNELRDIASPPWHRPDRGCRTGLRGDLRGQVAGLNRERRHLQLQRVQDHHLRRRRHAGHQRRGDLPSRLRDARPGPQPQPQGCRGWRRGRSWASTSE